ncbi:MAG TPA: hypothetical protein VFQ53_22335 [Kofleriaceae bacterium]|nr:hypothetical protein [Kofleriaceae bacterium]
MTVIARDAVASDHLVYAWPFPIGPECEVSCGDDEQVVMCPAWMVGDRLGPGRHRYRTPDPMRPVAAFFVLTAPVEVSFDMMTMFVIPTTGQHVRLRAAGSLQVRCADPGLMIAQFVGLPFDTVNDGILRSVSRSIERMLARLLTRRVVMSASPLAVTDPQMLPNIVEELVAYNPTAGAVFGVELIRMGHVTIVADDGNAAYLPLPTQVDYSGSVPRVTPENGHRRISQPDISLTETARGRPPPEHKPSAPMTAAASGEILSGEIDPKARAKSGELPAVREPDSARPVSQPGHAPDTAKPDAAAKPDGEARKHKATQRHASVPPASDRSDKLAASSGEILVRPKQPVPPPPPTSALGTSPPGAVVDVPRAADDITQPGIRTPVPGAVRSPLASSPGTSPRAGSEPSHESRGAIMGIGVSHIGAGTVAGEIPSKVAPGGRVLVPGPNGLMQSATVRQLLQGYYELEVGSSGETIWVPMNNVVPE